MADQVQLRGGTAGANNGFTGAAREVTVDTTNRTLRVHDGVTAGGNFLYGRANLIGTVSQTGGVPTGAVIERGSNANGQYARFADGTQICWKDSLQLTFFSVSSLQGSWTYPASFLTGGVTSISAHVKSASGVVADFASSATPAADQIFPGIAFSVGSLSSTSLGVFRSRGESDFTSGDTILVTPLAIGRWF